MQFLAPTNIFEGTVQLAQAPTAANHAVTKAYLEANAVVGIATDSANYVEFVTVNGQKQLKVKPLTITDVAVDTSATSLAGWITANYSNGNEKQEGDIIVLTAVSGRAQTYIHNGGTAGDATDFAEIQGADVTDAEIRGSLSASAGVNFNSSTGEFTADQGEIRGFFSAGSGLAYDGANGAFSLNVDSDGINEGTSNLYWTSSRSRGSISVTGAGIGYDSATGVISLAVGSDDITEENQLFFTEARSRGALSVATLTNDIQLMQYNATSGQMAVPLSLVFGQFSAGQGLAWDGGGEFSLDANTDDIAELTGATNKWFTDARARGAISVGAGLAYNQASGQIALAASSDNLSEGTSNLFYTDARAKAAISADAAAGNLAQYDSSTGEILVDIADFRKEFSPQNLTANTWATLNHGLGKKIIHVSAYDANGNLVQLDVQLVDSNNVKVKSVVTINSCEIVVSL